ncbi:MAG: hypothetical protein KDA86_12195 [Planctomycetaceae bacterium]|nr:hypothetical protein [Planctomycetaceae bacterium]
MISRNRPFQIAGMALMMAFGLSLLAAITDPRAIRGAILAKAEQTVPPMESRAVLVAEASKAVIEEPELTPMLAPEVVRPSLAATNAQSSVVVDAMPEVPRPYDHAPEGFQPSTNGTSIIDSQPVSSFIPDQQSDSHSDRRPTMGSMLVVSPEQLRGRSARSKEVEFLPPPPDMEHESESLAREVCSHTASLPRPASQPVDPDLSRRWMEAEILRLREEVHRLAESQQIAERLDIILTQQQKLLTLQQGLPTDRLIEVIDLLHQQLTTARASFPPRPEDARQELSRRSQTLTESASPQDGQGSLSITEAELQELLDLLERIADKSDDRVVRQSRSGLRSSALLEGSPGPNQSGARTAATLSGVQAIHVPK